MGAAKQRGTFEQRKALAEEKEQKRLVELAAYLEAKKQAMTPEERKKQRDDAYAAAVIASALEMWSGRK
jgi:hypothetical protein